MTFNLLRSQENIRLCGYDTFHVWYCYMVIQNASCTQQHLYFEW